MQHRWLARSVARRLACSGRTPAVLRRAGPHKDGGERSRTATLESDLLSQALLCEAVGALRDCHTKMLAGILAGTCYRESRRIPPTFAPFATAVFAFVVVAGLLNSIGAHCTIYVAPCIAW